MAIIWDAKEGGFTDADGDGEVDGTGYNTNGTVAGGDGYAFPADADNNGIADHLDNAFTLGVLKIQMVMVLQIA